MDTKICSLCKSSKPIDDFYLQKGKRFNRRSRCIQCEKEAYAQKHTGPNLDELYQFAELFIFANAMDEERFVPIKEFEGRYWISDFGRIISCDHRARTVNFLHPFIDFEKYYQVTLRSSPSKRKVRVHVLVGEYFISKTDVADTVINHLTGCKLFNYYKDLEWTTLRNNNIHSVETGLHDIKGEKHHNAKLTKVDVIQMRSLRASGLIYKEIGQLFGVTRRHASDVVRGVNWGWLKD